GLPEPDLKVVMLLPLVSFLQPFFLLGAVDRAEPLQVLMDLRIVEPCLEDRRVLDLERPETDPWPRPERAVHGPPSNFFLALAPPASFLKAKKNSPAPVRPGGSRNIFQIPPRRPPPEALPRVRTLRRRDVNHVHAPAQPRGRGEGSTEPRASRHFSPNLRPGA